MIGAPVAVHHVVEGPADAPAVVLSHSLGATLATWAPQTEALARSFRVVRYDLRGDPYQITGNTWSSPLAYAVGDQVQVLYPPGEPRAARIYSWFDFWFIPALLGGVGLLFALVGIGIGYAFWNSLG